MADTKFTGLSAQTTPLSADIFPFITDPAGTPTGKKVTFANIEASLTVANQIGGTASGTGNIIRVSNATLINPALGTPASGTLTNCTGLPVAGITASTSTALGVGSIELGAASDTTIARSGAGAITVEGVQVILSGAALGTPASGTLTNCTGLPVAGITASTVTALGVGSIELGAASDTTIARVSAGVASVEGNTIVVNTASPTLATITTTGNIELGNASDTTLSRSSAGVLAVEGVTVSLNSTSATHTAGTIELGAASDTTLARVSAGVVSIEGVNIETTTTTANTKIAVISFIIDGGGSAITTGIKGDLEIPFACTINRATTLADQSGSIVIDIWKDTYANYPPTVADTITASAKPTLSTATKAQDATLTGWTTSISAGDTLRFNVDSITTCTRVLLSLKVTKT